MEMIKSIGVWAKGNVKEIAIMALASVLCIYHLVTTIERIPTMEHRSIHLLLVLILTFLIYPLSRKQQNKITKAIDGVLLGLSIIGVGYVVLYWPILMDRCSNPAPLDLVLGVITIAVILEATRRTVGPMLPILAVIFLAYAWFGRYIPGYFGHPGFAFERIIGFTYQTLEGIFGLILGVSAVYISIFTIFGGFLEATGISEFFSDLALAAFGKSRGGASKASVITSGFLGMVCGSSTAAAIMTHDLMKHSMQHEGYDKETLAAFYSAAGTGAIIMPPVMGAVAFIMAYMAEIPYVEVCKMAILPAILYYLTVILVMDIKARKLGLKGLPKEKIPRITTVLKRRFHMFIPII
ncbi:MAG: C4-dicarboxylate ABC transporter permease, partial [Thermoprotei archaeon]